MMMGNDDEIIRQGVKHRAAEIESGLCEWIAANTRPADGTALAVALLRMGVNGHVGVMGEADAMAHLAEIFSREKLRVMQ